MTLTITRTIIANEQDLNRDPLSGTPGAHPSGTGAGAASGGVAGAAVGMAVGGPVGCIVGAAAGAIAGGLSGKSMAEAVNPTAEQVFNHGAAFGGFSSRNARQLAIFDLFCRLQNHPYVPKRTVG